MKRQINIMVDAEYIERLKQTARIESAAQERAVSLTTLILDALTEKYPPVKSSEHRQAPKAS